MRKDEFPIVDAYVKSVLEDIKAEIKDLPKLPPLPPYWNDSVDRNAVLEIIDNYISGENKE